MSTFYKVILRNIIKGPSTMKYPFEDSPASEKLRGKIKHNPEACIACHMCEYVCAGGAIRIQESEDKESFRYTVWHNTCTFCGLCEHYCPTNAIHLTNDYHTAHLQEDKYDYCEKTIVKKQHCICCGEPIVTLSPMLIEKAYGKDGDVRGLSKMCPKCRRKVLWEDGGLKNDRTCKSPE
ncbi:MAG TPA: 4Fe-4S dicluster domain-containing protein [Clostridia bacterium]|nr:4Fe-4S dicluster domain-containing protein [Clostridia bacterium]